MSPIPMGISTHRRALLALPLALGGICLWPGSAAAASAPYGLRNTDMAFLAIELGGSVALCAVAFLVSSAVEGPDPECGWCETNGFDRAVRNLLVAEDTRAPALASNILLGGAVPAASLSGLAFPALAREKGWFALQDTIVVVNSVLIASLLTELTKSLSTRRRPFYAHGRQLEPVSDDLSPGEFRSFFSGHAAVSSSLAASASTLAFARGYRVAPYLAAGTGALALTTAILRIVADKHWATDVIAGVAVGTLVGVLLPLALHPREQPDPSSQAATLSPRKGAVGPSAKAVGPTPVWFAW